MLGKLATWLRLTGHDAMFSTLIHDDEFLRIAIDSGGILLTSDEELYHRGVLMQVLIQCWSEVQ